MKLLAKVLQHNHGIFYKNLSKYYFLIENSYNYQYQNIETGKVKQKNLIMNTNFCIPPIHSRTGHKRLAVSNSVRKNLILLSKKLVEETDNEDLQMSYSSQDERDQILQQTDKASFDLIEELVSNYDNVQKSIFTYSKLIQKSQKLNNHAFAQRQDGTDRLNIFQCTTFHKSLHRVFDNYLIHRVKYDKKLLNMSKTIDLFYKFIYSQQQRIPIEQMWQFIGQDSRWQSIGDWFRTQAIENLLKNYISGKKQYTKFMVKFMKHGLSYLFVCCSKIINRKGLQEITQNQIEVIKLVLVSKLGKEKDKY